MPPVRNDTTLAAGGNGTGKRGRSAAAKNTGTSGGIAPTQQDAQIRHA